MMPLDKRNSIIAKATGFLAVGHCFQTTASFYHTAGAQCMQYEHTFCVPFLCDGSAKDARLASSLSSMHRAVTDRT